MIKVGILGASGYMGGEALRVLNEHPQVEVAWATSRTGQPLDYFHRNFYGSGLKLISPEEITPVDAIFFAIPTGTPMKMAAELLDQGTKLIDLGADFRLKNRADWERVYKRQHAAWPVAEEAVYGIPELHREEIAQARVIANPGCYSSAAILGLAPLLKAGLIDAQKIIVDGLSGTTGAGAEVDVTTHHPEIGNNLIPYNVVDHRHTYEMEQELGLLSEGPVTVHFTSTYVPITRGILAICHCFPTRSLRRSEVLDLYHGFYEGEQFVKVFDVPPDSQASWQYRPYPWVAAVSGTNYCHIGLDIDETRHRLVVFSVLDSVGKGGAHAGVQNLNLMFGLEEKTGLERLGLHPY
ncbi:MAG: N-acetyl-gamma-glutamyl-phosphate reductase [Anaerolineaceae bacterium]|nr:N-acetyl-gamma-glutamyl-phosphate reductase [Anaerolineaceae bacterium]MCB9099058.1 N-acetyl-gamma-glutamyl-phosphate reductase [Anaerolineales bacterium]